MAAIYIEISRIIFINNEMVRPSNPTQRKKDTKVVANKIDWDETIKTGKALPSHIRT